MGTTTADITALGITVTGITANDKVYDGGASATISSNSVVLSGVLPADVGQVDLSTNGYAATFASADVGDRIGVTVNGLSLTGAKAGDYALTAPAGLTAKIAQAAVTIDSGITANDKVYDGGTSATIRSNSVVLSGVLGADAGQVDAVDQRVCGHVRECGCGQQHWGERERAEPDRGQGGGLPADGAGGIDGEHHGAGDHGQLYGPEQGL